MNVSQLVASYTAVRMATLAPKTIVTQRAQLARVVVYLGKDTDIASVTPEQAVGIVAWAKTQTRRRSPTATWVRETKVSPVFAGWVGDMARRLFAYAVRQGYLANSPFSELVIRGVKRRGAKTYFSPEDLARLMEHVTHEPSRRYLALMRFGGLRSGEALAIRWRDLNLATGMMHIQGKRGIDGEYRPRQTPIQPALRAFLEVGESHSPTDPVAPVTPQNVMRRLVGKSGGNGGAFAKAGLTPFPRLFHSLRASLVSDWQAKYPPMDVCSWLGHSIVIASQNYHQALSPSVQRVVSGD